MGWKAPLKTEWNESLQNSYWWLFIISNNLTFFCVLLPGVWPLLLCWAVYLCVVFVGVHVSGCEFVLLCLRTHVLWSINSYFLPKSCSCWLDLFPVMQQWQFERWISADGANSCRCEPPLAFRHASKSRMFIAPDNTHSLWEWANIKWSVQDKVKCVFSVNPQFYCLMAWIHTRHYPGNKQLVQLTYHGPLVSDICIWWRRDRLSVSSTRPKPQRWYCPDS